ncbi:MAG: hypothetical protein ABFD54_06305 [Armatimonadota bacterium]|nr:hypothetical protein [bacterium]
MEEKDLEGRTPAEERSEIGTPAGESPEEGRKRHGTEPLTPEGEEVDEIRRRGTIEEEISDEDFYEEGNEISTTGGITGTKVKGGIPSGGILEGGTLPPSADEPRWEDKK